MSVPPSAERRIFVNRTLNLRSIKAIGYDMDYTLVHYNAAEWETLAFEHARRRLEERGWPVGHLAFEASDVIRGLALDLEEGNLVKATRFGYVIKASHGTQMLDFDAIRSQYQVTSVDLSEERFDFVNVLFSLSEASLFAQLVDLMDDGQIPRYIGYAGLFTAVREALDGAHAEGDLKRAILDDPDRYVVQDPEMVLALLDQHHAGKRLMLITNAEWAYTRRLMAHTVDRHLPEDMGWRDVFETIIVSADKPSFFTSNAALYKVEDEERSLLSPHRGAISPGSVFFGGCARRVETSMRLSDDEVLYVGDHLFGDVHFSKDHLRWRTALILRELESEVAAAAGFRPNQEKLVQLMGEKEATEAQLADLRLARQRARRGYATGPPGAPPGDEEDALKRRIAQLDNEIGPLARAAGRLRNETWGPLMRAGIDKSLFARQVERYADVYTSRVSNFLFPGPYSLLRADRAPLPHDEVA